MDFVAIDFETANPQRCSACALGIAMVSGRSVTEWRSWLIRPPELHFSPFNMAIHGIGPEDVAGEPDFSELWPDVEPYLSRGPVAAHNASFDLSVLSRSLEAYGIPSPDLEAVCTRYVAKALWPKLPTYNLKAVAGFLGIEFEHHNAVEDAVACARIVLRACDEAAVGSLCELSEFVAERLSARTYGSRAAPQKTARDLKARDIHPSADGFHPLGQFVRRTFVFTGALCSMERKEAMQRVVDAGGECADSVTKRTNYLVVGGLYSAKFTDGYKTGKLKKAVALIKDGNDLEILTEDDFLGMLHE